MTYNRFINCATLSIFNTSIESGSITDSDLVFIEDTKQIWTHGTYYSCPYTKDEIDNLVGSVLTKANIEKVLTGNITSHTHNQYLTSYTETDPTVPSWAKKASKPTYTASEVGALAAGGTAVNASKVANSLTLKLNSGTTEGTNLYTFNGSAAKTLDIKAGSNVTLTAAAGSLTISSSYTNTTYSAGSGLSLSGTTFNHASSITAGTVSDGGATRTLGWGGTFKIPSVTYNATGHITGVRTITLTMPANPNTNTTYTFASGSAGSFTVTPSGGSAQTVSIGKPSTAGVADSAKTVNASATGTNQLDLVYAAIADNDQFRIRVGGTATNAGWVELATADDGSEPIYVRQYTGVFATVARTATLLDGSGNTSFPGTVTASKFSGPLTGTVTGNCTGNSATATKLATARTITLSGSVTGSASFDGSSNVTISTSTNHTHSYLPLSGGTMTGALILQGTGSASSYASGVGAFHNGYANLILRGNSSSGVSGIVFTSSKGTTSINQTSDKAFIQFHPLGVTTLTAEGTNPTLSTSGEANKLVIGVGNDSDDMIYLQTPGGTGLRHIVSGTNNYIILDSGNWSSYVTYVPRDRGSNTVTTLSSLPVTKSLVKATLSAATNISLASNMTEGESMTVICTPTASFTQPLPNSGSWTSMDGSSLSVTSEKKFEINIYCIASGTYSISCKVAK